MIFLIKKRLIEKEMQTAVVFSTFFHCLSWIVSIRRIWWWLGFCFWWFLLRGNIFRRKLPLQGSSFARV